MAGGSRRALCERAEDASTTSHSRPTQPPRIENVRELRSRPAGRATQGTPKGRRSRVPFSLVTFFWASKRKSPAAGLHPATLQLRCFPGTYQRAEVLSATATYNPSQILGLSPPSPMARHDSHDHRRMAHRLPGQTQTPDRLLVLPAEQCPVGDLGLVCSGLRTGYPADRPRLPEHPWNLEE